MNENIRLRARGAGVPLWAVARELQISESTLTRWLRVPLSAEQEHDIKAAIERLKEGAEYARE